MYNIAGAPQAGVDTQPTFSFSQEGTPQLQIGEETKLRGGVQGGDAPGGLMQAQALPPPKANPTLELLSLVGQELLAPKMKELKMQGFVRGMQRAAQGEAVTDMARDQPWYAKLFGDTDAVEGARAYAGATAAQNTLNTIDQDMGNLRQLPPEKANEVIVQAMNAGLTGDAATDMAVMGTLVQQLPTVMRRQAKEYYAYIQERAMGAQAAAFSAGATLVQSVLRAPNVSQDDIVSTKQQFRMNAQPVPGQDMDNYLTQQAKLLSVAAHRGDFHAVNAIVEPEGDYPGMMGVFTPEQQRSIQSAIDTGEARARARFSTKHGNQLAALKADAARGLEGDTAVNTGHAIDAFNEQYMRDTGSSRGIIGPEERAGMVSGKALQVMDARVANAKAAGAAYDRAQQEAEKHSMSEMKQVAVKEAAERLDAELWAATTSGDLGQLLNNPGYSSRVFTAVVPRFLEMNEEEQVSILALNTRNLTTIDPIKQALDGGLVNELAGGQLTPEVQKRLASAKRLYEKNPATMADYYPSNSKKIVGYLADINLGMTEAGAFNKRFLRPAQESSLSDTQLVKVIGDITSEYNSYLPGFLGGQKLEPGQARRAAIELQGAINTWHGATGDVGSAVKMAMTTAKTEGGRGIEFTGGFVTTFGKDQLPMQHILATTVGPNGEDPIPSDKASKLLKEAISRELYGDGGTTGILSNKTSDVFVHRVDGTSKYPLLEIHAIIDGIPKRGFVNTSKLYKARQVPAVPKVESTTAEPAPPEQPMFGD